MTVKELAFNKEEMGVFEITSIQLTKDFLKSVEAISLKTI